MSENVGNAINMPTDGTDWDETWVVAFNQRHYRKTFFSVLVVTANRTVNVLVLWGVEIKNVHNFDETLMTVCHCVTKKEIKYGRNTANINTIKPRKFYHC